MKSGAKDHPPYPRGSWRRGPFRPPRFLSAEFLQAYEARRHTIAESNVDAWARLALQETSRALHD